MDIQQSLSERTRSAAKVNCRCDVRITGGNRVPVSNWICLPEAECDRAEGLFSATSSILPDGHPYGVAVDLGTTRIRVSLWDVLKRLRLAGREGLNPQASFGTDVLTRLAVAADSQARALELGWLARCAIREALFDIGTETGHSLSDIGQVVIAGNTAMLALLAEKNQGQLLQPKFWTRAIDCEPAETSTWAAAWGVAPNACVEVLPSVAGFVGSDFLAAALATGLIDGPAGSLLIDFGTNSEIGLWDGTVLWATAAAGGPAFEGSGISCGLSAEPGAIFKVAPADSSPLFQCEVIGGGAASGLCGSGLVDIIANLLKTGKLTSKGLFTKDVGSEGVLIARGRQDVVLTKRDIDVLQRAKAAISAGTVCLLEKAGLHAGNLQRICVCGAFGSFLNIAHAQEIGLLPEISPLRVEMHGQAALTGCELLLLSGNRTAMLEPLRKRARIFNLAQTSNFEKHFIDGLCFQPMSAQSARKDVSK